MFKFRRPNLTKYLRHALVLWVTSCCVLILAAGCAGQPQNIPDVTMSERAGAEQNANEDANGLQSKNQGQSSGERAELFSVHPSFVTGRELAFYLASRAENKSASGGRIASAVVPHHLVAGSLIAEAMEQLVPQKRSWSWS
jgi:hypothetical protein